MHEAPSTQPSGKKAYSGKSILYSGPAMPIRRYSVRTASSARVTRSSESGSLTDSSAKNPPRSNERLVRTAPPKKEKRLRKPKPLRGLNRTGLEAVACRRETAGGLITHYVQRISTTARTF